MLKEKLGIRGISISEMAKALNICRGYAYELANSEGFYPAIRISERRIIISVEALERWLREQEGNSEPILRG